MTAKKTEYRVISSTHDQDLADGRVVEPGGTVSLTAEQVSDPHNQDLIRRGLLVEIPDDSGSKAKAKNGGGTTAKKEDS